MNIHDNHADSRNKYDPNIIIQAANSKLAVSDLEGGQMIFQSALLAWVDDAREGGGHEVDSLREAIATLWLAYAHYLASANQFKSATEAYEQAVSCPVARSVGRVWLDYVRFATERGKHKTAQDLYVRALVGKASVDGSDHSGPAVEDEQDQTLLWQEFLDMMRQTNPSLTLSELREACLQQKQQQQPNLKHGRPDNVLSYENAAGDDGGDTSSPLPKRPRSTTPVPPSSSSLAPPPSRTHVVTPESVQVEAAALLESLLHSSSNHETTATAASFCYLPPEIMAQWMLRDGTGLAQAPEPPLFGQPTPPKLSDPTAKDLLGADLALAVIERLLVPSGNVLLDVCCGLWTLHALRETQAQQIRETVDNTLLQQYEQLESNLEARVSVAGAALTAVEHMNHNERVAFQTACHQQREQVCSNIAWEFRQLLCLQQELLTKLAVPKFDGPTVDTPTLTLQSKICSYLHSAFYLRSRIGQEPHVNMLKSQVKRLQREQQENASERRSPKQQEQQQFEHFSAVPPNRYSPKLGGMTMPQLVPPSLLQPSGVMMQGQVHYGGPPPTLHSLLPPPLMQSTGFPGQPIQHQQQQQQIPQQHLSHMMPPNPPQYPAYYQ